MGGIHIADALEIPYFRGFTMTWTRTRAYPHAFGVPDRKVCASGFRSQWTVLSLVRRVSQMGGNYNYLVSMRFCVNFLGDTYATVVVRTLRPDLLERYRRPGQ